MTEKNFFRNFIALLMLILFSACLSNMFFKSDLHEISGCTFIIVAIIHNLVNRNFYRRISNAKLTKSLLMNCICLFLFSITLGALTFSGVALSNDIFVDMKIPDIVNWRIVHKFSAIATLLVLVIHLRCSVRSEK